MTANLAPGSASFQRTCEQVRTAGGPWPGRLARALGDSRLSSLQRAKEAFEAKNYEQAFAQAEAGLKASAASAGAEMTSVEADLGYVKFAALWNLHRWRETHLAGMAFLQEQGADRRASEVCSRTVRSGLNALGSNPPALTPAQFLQNLDFVEKQGAAVAAVRTARWDAARVCRGMHRLGDAEAILRTIGPGSPTYGWAQHDLAAVLCVLYQQANAGARAGSGPPKQASGWLKDSGAALIRFADYADARPSEPNAPSPKDMETLTATVAGELLRHKPPDPNLALRVLEGIGRLPQVGGSDRLQALRIEANASAGNVDAALTLATALPAGLWASQPIKSACLRVVSGLEEKAAAGADRGRPAEVERSNEQVVALLQLLLERAGQNPQNATESLWLRLHLAETLTRLGRYEEAVNHYTWVVEHSAAENAGLARRRGPLVRCRPGGRRARRSIRNGPLAKGPARGRACARRCDLCPHRLVALARGLHEDAQGRWEALVRRLALRRCQAGDRQSKCTSTESSPACEFAAAACEPRASRSACAVLHARPIEADLRWSERRKRGNPLGCGSDVVSVLCPGHTIHG